MPSIKMNGPAQDPKPVVARAYELPSDAQRPGGSEVVEFQNRVFKVCGVIGGETKNPDIINKFPCLLEIEITHGIQTRVRVKSILSEGR